MSSQNNFLKVELQSVQILKKPLKEARETHYWVRLLKATGHFDELQADSLLEDLDATLKIIGKTQITSKNNS